MDDANEDGPAEPPEERPTVRIPMAKRGDEVVEWRVVDAEWWDHVQHAREVHELVVERFRYEPGVESIGRSRGNETIAGLATSAITIGVTDEETAAALEIPEEIEGIPINVEIGSITDVE